MPELPEVETIKKDLAKNITNKRIERVLVNKKKIIKSSVKDFVQTLKGDSFVKINRRAKLLIAPLKKGNESLLIHLKMTGQLIYRHNKKIVSGGHPQPFFADNLPNKYSDRKSVV